MGAVFRARSPDGRDVAIKIVLGARAELLERFERERRLLAALSEAEGFVPLLDAGSADRGAYIVMPFMSGGTLRDRLDRGPLAVGDALELARALARAMAAAHAR